MGGQPPLETILRQCAAAAPVPWYPSKDAASLGLLEEDVSAFVEQLRGGGLIARTDAVPGYGRGYVLTPLGVQALDDPEGLAWLRRGEVPPRKARPAEDEPAEAPDRGREVRMSLQAPFTPHVVRGLIAVNVVMFLWGVYLGHKQGIELRAFVQPVRDLLDVWHATGSLTASDVLAPGWGYVRLLASCFVHLGLIHLAMSMFSIYLVGPQVERLWGHVRFLVLYLVAGFGGNCVSVILKPMDGNVPLLLAGGTGIFWGLFASIGVWIVLNRRYLPRRLVTSWAMNLLFGCAINIGISYLLPGNNAQEQWGGAAVGAVCALFLHFTRFGPGPLRVLAALAVAGLPVFGLWAVAHPTRFNARWAGQEKALVELKKAEEKRRGERDFEKRVMPAVKEMEQQALKHVPDAVADPIINRNPARRDEERVKQTIQAYADAEAALGPAPDLLRKAGPYDDPDIEKARQVRLQLVEARLDLFARNKRCLEAGKDWPNQEEAERLKAVERVQELESEWRKLLK
jgi:rhomboid protease GluP